MVPQNWARSIGFIKFRSGTREHPVEQEKDDVLFAVAIEVPDAGLMPRHAQAASG